MESFCTNQLPVKYRLYLVYIHQSRGIPSEHWLTYIVLPFDMYELSIFFILELFIVSLVQSFDRFVWHLFLVKSPLLETLRVGLIVLLTFQIMVQTTPSAASAQAWVVPSPVEAQRRCL